MLAPKHWLAPPPGDIIAQPLPQNAPDQEQPPPVDIIDGASRHTIGPAHRNQENRVPLLPVHE